MKNKKSLIHILGIYLVLMVLIPKGINNIMGVPIRLLLSFLYVLINAIFRIKNKDYKIEGKKYLLLGLVFLLSCIPSLFVTKSMITSLYTIIKFAMSFLVFVTVYNTHIKKTDFKILSKYLFGMLSVLLIYGLLEYVFEINLFTIGAYNFPGSKGRITTSFFNTIYLSIFLNMIISFLTYLLGVVKKHVHQAVVATFLVLSYICLLLTFTRSAILVFVGCLIVSIAINYRVIFRKLTIITYIIMISLSFLIPGVKYLYLKTFFDVNTLVVTNETEDASLNSRIKFSEIGKQLGKDYFPTGVGFGSYENYVYSYEYETNYPNYKEYKTYPHSTLILLFAEASIWPVIVMAVILITAGLSLLEIWLNNKNKETKGLAALIIIILGGFTVVNVIAENAIYDSQIFPIFLLIIGGIYSYLNEVIKCQK